MGGVLGGNPTPLGNAGMAETLNHPFFKAKSPDQQTHSWHGNEVSFFDQPDKQQMYLQAERDMNVVVKNTQTSVIGNVRSAQVGTDDVVSVGHKQLNVIVDNQTTSVGGNRYVNVAKNQAHVVTGDINVEGQKNQTYDITETFKSTSKVHHFVSHEKIILQVGSSTVVIAPNFIVIQAEDVFINPGAEETQKAADGKRPEKPEEKAARELKQQRANNAFKRANDDYANKRFMYDKKETPERYLERRFVSHYQAQGGNGAEGKQLYGQIASGDYPVQ
jgi:type VI secretion system secreted protein VgrG